MEVALAAVPRGQVVRRQGATVSYADGRIIEVPIHTIVGTEPGDIETRLGLYVGDLVRWVDPDRRPEHVGEPAAMVPGPLAAWIS